ncbi:MFS transporter [Streptomyces sp. NPDC058464]|uniref:MFS transporter n=1 Tax=Streptomyces sp. NPDC058464 TaxID=3346511 RepID=UPI00365ACADF
MTRTPPVPQDVQAASAAAPERLGARAVLILLALVWPAQLFMLAGILTSVSAASIAQHYHTTQIAWFTLVYALGGALFTPFVTRAGDVFGRKRVLVAVIGAGLLGDILQASASSYEVMLAGRLVASLYLPVTALVVSAVRDLFPPRHVGTATGAIGAAMGAVIVLGPLLGGQLLDRFGFRAVLWTIVAGVALALLLAVTLVPELPGTGERAGFDWAGGLTLGGAAAMLSSALGIGGTAGWTSGPFQGTLYIGILLTVLFVLVERRAARPLLDVRLLARRDLGTVLAATAVGQGAAWTGGTLIIYLALYPRIPGVSDGLGWSATHQALVIMPCGLVFLLAGLLAGRLAGRADPRLPWLCGLLLAACGLVAQAYFHADEVQVILAGVPSYLGAGMVMACSPILLMSVVDRSAQGVASGMQLTAANLVTTLSTQCMFLALAVGGTVLKGTAFYRDSGYRAAYLTLAAFMAVALLLSLLIPRIRPASEITAGPTPHGPEPVV